MEDNEKECMPTELKPLFITPKHMKMQFVDDNCLIN